MAIKSSYTTLEESKVPLDKLIAAEREFLGELTRRQKNGVSYLDFENLYMDPASPVFAHSKRLGKPVSETPLFQVCADMAKRLGIQQGFLVREEVVRTYGAKLEERKELTTGEVAKLADCTDEAVRKAIRTGRLRARRVGRYSFIAESDALAFVRAREGALHPA